MDIIDRARELIGDVKTPLYNPAIAKTPISASIEDDGQTVRGAFVDEDSQPKTLLDTVKVANQKTKVVDGEQVMVEDLGETGNTISPPEKVKTKRGETFKNNTIEIWNNDGKYGISINKQLHEIPEPIYDLFLRMVENHRQILTELENEIHNNKKLKVGMVQ